MQLEDYRNLAQFRGLDLDKKPEIIDVPVVVKKSDLDRVLDEIFSVDPVSGLPKGDIAYYLSPDSNPDVKLWLENNLLRPRSVGGKYNPDVTDDMIVEMSKRPDEDIESYSRRLASLRSSAEEEYQRLVTEYRNNSLDNG